MNKIIIFIIALLLVSCGKEYVFEATDSDQMCVIRLDLSKVGDPSRMSKKIILFWNDTIIIDGVKNAPLKDTLRFEEVQDYYGADTLTVFEKYKAKNWYIRYEYYFTGW